ncbi:hypothetical protein [Pseudomonas sp. 24 E 13]|uniref:hypothetical protein n=1 Tax=Pseudomonas sp. 24 E 13 TaxID=1844095 RepID=UPI000811E47C|nr:hypothetical protein [Pseudomonas sp. 24 E 13]CRM19596.1 hypothetical protein [Pseudomonas sp. 24 E 13]
MNETELHKFRGSISALLKPFNWSPTNTQLEELARKLAEANASSIKDVSEVFSEMFPSLRYDGMEGIDNSDYKTLLAMAIASAKASKK